MDLPREFQRTLKYAENNTIVLDGLEVPSYFKQMAGLGPKFAFPDTHNKQDIIGLTTVMQMIADSIPNWTITKRTMNEYFQAVQRHRDNKQTDGNSTANREGNGTRENIERYLCQEKKKCLHFLANNPEIIVTESDKGHKTIICTKTTLYKKREDFIKQQVEDGTYITIGKHSNYTDTISKLRKAKTKQLELIIKQINPILSDDRLAGLPTIGYGILEPSAYIIARLDVAIKSHKGTTYPIRPIIANPTAMGPELEEYILSRIELIYEYEVPNTRTNSIRARLAGNTFITKDAQTVHDNIDGLEIDRSHKIFSIDFVNMYTNINLQKAIDIIDENFDDKIRPTTSIPRKQFIYLIKTIISINKHFTANSKIYAQNKGLPMGGKLSYALSEIVTSQGVMRAVNQAVENGVHIDYLAKYVDDILIIMDEGRDSNNIDTISQLIEHYIPGMPVTYEKEAVKNGHIQLKYLNISIIRQPTKKGSIIRTRWTKHDFATGRTINAWSAQEREIKTNMIKETLRTAIRLSSHIYIPEAISQIWSILENNGYTTGQMLDNLREVCGDENIRYEYAIKNTKQIKYNPDLTDTRMTGKEPDKTGQNNNKRINYKCAACGCKTRTYELTKQQDLDKTCRKCGKNTRKRTQREDANNNTQDISITKKLRWNDTITKEPRQTNKDNDNAPQIEPPTQTEPLTQSRGTTARTATGGNTNRTKNTDGGTITLSTTNETDVRTNTHNTTNENEKGNTADQQQQHAQTVQTGETPSTTDQQQQHAHLAQTTEPTTMIIRQYRETGTQTRPIKARSQMKASTVSSRKLLKRLEPIMPGHIEYIGAPYVRGLTEQAREIIKNAAVDTKIMCRGNRNPLFRDIKDKIDKMDKSRATFSFICKTCKIRVYRNAWHNTIGEEAARLQKQKTFIGHEIDMDSIRIEKEHSAKSKAKTALRIYNGTIATSPEKHGVYITNMYNANTTAILKEMYTREQAEIEQTDDED